MTVCCRDYIYFFSHNKTCIKTTHFYLYDGEWLHTQDKSSRLQGLCLMMVSSSPYDTWKQTAQLMICDEMT